MGLRLWSKAAWNDSRTGQLKLTDGSSLVVPEIPRIVQRAIVYQWDTVANGRATGFGPFWGSSHNPLVRYAR